jgi:hypothetical protein
MWECCAVDLRAIGLPILMCMLHSWSSRYRSPNEGKPHGPTYVGKLHSEPSSYRPNYVVMLHCGPRSIFIDMLHMGLIANTSYKPTVPFNREAKAYLCGQVVQ